MEHSPANSSLAHGCAISLCHFTQLWKAGTALRMGGVLSDAAGGITARCAGIWLHWTGIAQNGNRAGEVRPSVGQNCPMVVIAEGLVPAAKGDPATALKMPVV